MKTKQEKNRYNLKNDIIFKSFFARKGNEEFLIDFLEALLKIEIKEIVIRDEVNLEQLSVEERGGRLDLQAELDGGTIVNIELQMQNESDIRKRTMFYGAKVMSRNVERGARYNDITKVIMVNILNYNIFEYEECVSKTVTVLDKHRECEVIDDMTYYFIELKKFRNKEVDMNDRLNQWLAVIDDTDEGRIKMAEVKNKVLQRARTEIIRIAGPAEEGRLADLRDKWEMDRISALSYAEEKGRSIGETIGEARGKKQGNEEKAKEIAKKLLEQNINIEIIISATGLTKAEIENLK